MPSSPISTGSSPFQSVTDISQMPQPESPARAGSSAPRLAEGMPGLAPRGSLSSSPPSHRATLPRTSIAATPSRATNEPPLRHAEQLMRGISQAPELAAAFQQIAASPPEAAMHFIASNVNPRGNLGMLTNALGMLTGGAPALNQNCVFCSAAAEHNLEALASGRPPEAFWVAHATTSGTLPPQGSQDVSVLPHHTLSAMLGEQIPEGRRGIISVPQRGSANYNHAMNCVHLKDGGLHVIDGQNKKVYDLSKPADVEAFDRKFGHNGGLCIARFFETGAAPQKRGV